MKTLLVVDLQKDFMPDGRLPVLLGYDAVAWFARNSSKYDEVICTKDLHPLNHCSFERNGGTWPEHCVDCTQGSNLVYSPPSFIVFNKGIDPRYDSYSGFKDDGGKRTGLEEFLLEKKITEIDIVGVATEYCVKFTVLDALAYGFKVNVIKDGCAGITPEGCEAAYAEMEAAGATIVYSNTKNN